MSTYETIYFRGNNQTINRVQVNSSKTGNPGTFLGSFATLLL